MRIQHLFLTVMVTCFLSSVTFSQDLIQYPAGTLEFEIEQPGGANGVAVVYNPEKQLYYCAMAGNASFPLETFNKNGTNLYQSRTYSDMRGMWWNPKEGTLEGNCYLDGGIVSVGISDLGYAGIGNRVLFEGDEYQPGEHTCGTYDPKKKEILYYFEGVVFGYSSKDGRPTETFLVLSLPVDSYNINWTSLIFTGKKKMELGVLDVVERQVYLFDRKTGDHTATVHLPSDAIVYETFNFAFANDYIFLFNKDNRTWTGYKIF